VGIYGESQFMKFLNYFRLSKYSFLALFLCIICANQPSLAQSKEKVRFGALAELSGPGALNGAACQAGYRVAASLFAEQYPALSEKVEIVYGDHRREPKAAISEFQRISAMGVWGVACNHSIVGVAINPLSKAARIPLLGVMGHESFIRDNPFAIRIIPTPEEEGGALARTAFKRGARKAAILLLQDDYILALGTAFQKNFEELGGKVVYKDEFPESLNDFSSIATRIRSTEPDIIQMTLGFQQFGGAIKRLREQGVKQPIYSNYWLSYPQVIAAAGAENLDGRWIKIIRLLIFRFSFTGARKLFFAESRIYL
jgi:branched-chain amino acid transport system substrate-binding protein